MEKNQVDHSQKKWIRILLLLLLLSFAANILLLVQLNQKDTLVEQTKANVDSLMSTERALNDEIQNITFELDQFRGKNLQLDSLLQKADAEIYQQKLRIEKLMRENGDLKLVKRQLEELRLIRDQYRSQIDQLIAENKELRNLNLDLSQKVDNLAKEKSTLSEKVEIASALKAEMFSVKTYREKGRGQLSETDRAKRVSRVDAVLTIAENRVANKGNRELYFRLIGPNGVVLSDPNGNSGSFISKTHNRNMDYTQRKSFNYSNQQEEIKFEFSQTEEFKSGLYLVEAYLDGVLIADNKFTLK